MSESRISDLEAALAAKDAEIEELRDPSYCSVCGSCGEPGCCGTKRCKYLNQHQGDYDDLVKDNDAAEASLSSARQEIERLKRIISAYDKSGFADSDAMAEKYLDAELENASLKRELEEAQKDRERLDWLDDNGDSLDSFGYGSDDKHWKLIYNDGNTQEDVTVRRAIDAARSEGGNTSDEADGGTPR